MYILEHLIIKHSALIVTRLEGPPLHKPFESDFQCKHTTYAQCRKRLLSEWGGRRGLKFRTCATIDKIKNILETRIDVCCTKFI
jgi:hypothetical protein